MSDTATPATPPAPPKFERDKHLRFLQGCLRLLPSSYAAQDPNRLTLLYFVVSGLDVLNSLELIKDKTSVIDWIYSLQILPDKDNPRTSLHSVQSQQLLLIPPSQQKSTKPIVDSEDLLSLVCHLMLQEYVYASTTSKLRLILAFFRLPGLHLNMIKHILR